MGIELEGKNRNLPVSLSLDGGGDIQVNFGRVVIGFFDKTTGEFNSLCVYGDSIEILEQHGVSLVRHGGAVATKVQGVYSSDPE